MPDEDNKSEPYSRDESHVAIVSFHGAVKREAAKVQAMLADANIDNQFELKVEVGGRTHGGDISLKYSLAGSRYGDTVEGNELNAVVEEFMRRKGWTKQHAPKLITRLTNDADVPY